MIFPSAAVRSLASLGLLLTMIMPCHSLYSAEQLFNGADLAGWTKLGGEATYHVDGGEIVGTSADPASPNTFLVTEQTYGDFSLDADFFISDVNFNSGIQIRSHSLPEHNGGRVFGYQVEIDPTARAWTGGVYFEGGSPERNAGWLDDLDDNPTAQAAFLLGEWNHFRIVAEGRRIQTWINGVPAADYTDPSDEAFLPSGFIGLQVHQVSSSEPREVRWRNLVLGSVATLVVNRETGEVSFTNSMNAAIELSEYTISSAAGSLVGSDGGWLSLGDQQQNGWSETNATSHLLEEIGNNPFSILGGTTHSLGMAYAPTPVAFGVNAEDLAFNYSEIELEGLAGRVEYVGQNITNNLVLLVDPLSGQVVLQNTSPFAVAVTGYSVLSDSASLAPDAWQGFADRGLAGWDEASQTAEALAELRAEGELLLSGGDSYNLGSVFDFEEGQPDLRLEFLIADAEQPSLGAVVYRPAADFNFDDLVNDADLQRWEAAFGLDNGADADGDGDSDGRDILTWQRQFGLTVDTNVEPQSVPEPSGLAMTVCFLVEAFLATRKRSPLEATPLWNNKSGAARWH